MQKLQVGDAVKIRDGDPKLIGTVVEIVGSAAHVRWDGGEPSPTGVIHGIERIHMHMLVPAREV